jgi:hypothetical protein
MIVAKKYKQDWQFKRRYSSKEDNKLIYKGCQNADTFNLFLNSYKVDTGGYIIVSDYSDEMYINIICGDKKYTYEGKYPNNFKQPWYDHSDTSWISYHSLFNFDINKWLVAILPEDFYRRETIEISSFTNSYIKWYLKRKQIIWDYF